MSENLERIAKVMARAGVCSRRDAEKLILDGRVIVNGKKIDSPALNVGPKDKILVDGTPLQRKDKTRIWLYHKPVGLVTTHKDPQGRPTVFENLPKKLPRVVSVGRLDLNSEGLLLLTNDGELARSLENPKNGWKRTYRVRVFGRLDEKTKASLKALSKGCTIEKVRYRPIQVTFEISRGNNHWLKITLEEGKNREIRRVMKHFNLEVSRLIRISYGPYTLENMAKNSVKEVLPPKTGKNSK